MPISSNKSVFGEEVTNVRESKLNLASVYPYNAERWRLEVDGSRVFPEYGSVAQYDHTNKRHLLSPNAGETVTLRTAERPRYPVGFEIDVSFALRATKRVSELTGDDRVRVGIFDDEDGWALEYNSSHIEKQCDIIVLQGGSVVDRVEDVKTHRALDKFFRRQVETAWYDVTRQKWEVSYSINGQQINRIIGTSGGGNAGPNTPNLPISFEVRADSSTSDLELHAGSMAYLAKGPSGDVFRRKKQSFVHNLGTSDTWVPVRAYRVDPSRKFTNSQVNVVEIINWDQTDLLEVAFFSFANTNVTFGGGDSWSFPSHWSEKNNVMQERTDIDTIVDSGGASAQTPNNPGGFLLEYGAYKSNAKNTAGGRTGAQGPLKSNLTEDRVGILALKSSATGEATVAFQVTQNW